MKTRIIGIIFAALGLLLALGTQFLFKACPVLDNMKMVCHWTARAEIGVGGMIAALGIALALFTNIKTRLGLVIGVVLSCLLSLLIAQQEMLIGGCPSPMMPCRKLMIPAITAISGILLIGSALYTAFLARKK